MRWNADDYTITLHLITNRTLELDSYQTTYNTWKKRMVIWPLWLSAACTLHQQERVEQTDHRHWSVITTVTGHSVITTVTGQWSVLLVQDNDKTTDIPMAELSKLFTTGNKQQRHLFVFVDTLVFFRRAEPSCLSTGIATSVLLISCCWGTCLIISRLSGPWCPLFRGHGLFLFACRPWRSLRWSRHHTVIVAVIITVDVSFSLYSYSDIAISHSQPATAFKHIRYVVV